MASIEDRAQAVQEFNAAHTTDPDDFVKVAELLHAETDCIVCAARIEAMAAAMSLIFPTMQKMAEMFTAIENAREQNPMVAKMLGLGSNEPKLSRRERRAKLQEMMEDEPAEGETEDANAG